MANPQEPETTGGIDRWSEWQIPNVLSIKRDPVISILHLDSGLSSVSEDQMKCAIKQALTNAVERALLDLGHRDGFLTNQQARISLPNELQPIMDELRKHNQERLADGLLVAINRAAELTCAKGKGVFLQCISELNFPNPKSVVLGARGPGAQHFRNADEATLTKNLLPIVAATGVGGSFTNFADNVTRTNATTGTTIRQLHFDFDAYIAAQLIEKVFVFVSAEEDRIRNEESAQTTEVLRRVYGCALD